jgi:hypothetical protein
VVGKSSLKREPPNQGGAKIDEKEKQDGKVHVFISE